MLTLLNIITLLFKSIFIIYFINFCFRGCISISQPLIIKKDSNSFLMGVKKSFLHFMELIKKNLCSVMGLIKYFSCSVIVLITNFFRFAMKLVKNFYHYFLMFPISTKIMRIFSTFCFFMGLIVTLNNIIERSESIIIEKLLTMNPTVRPEMIILPSQNSLQHISKNKNNAITLAISRTEITFENYYFVVGGNVEDILNKTVMNKPITDTKLIDPIPYCNILSAIEGLEQCYYSGKKDIRECNGYRLPTKNEWLYAACAYTKMYYHTYLLSFGWFSNNTDQIHEVAKKNENAWGLYDTFGNVSELIHPNPYNANDSSSFTHIGCSFMDEVNDHCADDHKINRFDSQNNSIGFRVVRSIIPK